jgi:hypothetical protein
MVKTLFLRTLWLNTAMLLLTLHDNLHYSTRFRWMWTQWGNDRLLDLMCGSCGGDEETGKLLPCDLSNIAFILLVVLVIGIIFKPAQGF